MSFLLFLAAIASPNIYDMSGVWRIERNSSNCGMSSQSAEGDSVLVFHTYGSNKTDIVVMNRAFKSVEMKKKYRLHLFFASNSKLVRDWGVVEATGIISDGEKGVFVTLAGDEALDDLARSETMALMNGDVVAASIGLEETSISVPKLKQCALEVHKTNPIDPLLGAETK